MANWLNIVGGAGQGYVQGQGDLQRLEEHRQRKVEHEQRKAEFAHMQNQRARLEAEQKSDDELAAELGRVAPAGERIEETEAPAGLGETSGITKTTKTIKRSAADVDRERADVLAKTGKLKHLTAASQMRQGAFATEAAQRAEQIARGEDVLREAGRLRAAGNLAGAVRLLRKGYAQVPDGQDIVIEMKDGVEHIGVAGPGGFTQPLQPLTEKAVDDMIAKGWAMTSPERNIAQQKVGIDREQLAVQRIAAEAAQKNAQTAYDEMYWKTIGEGGKATVAKANAEVARDRAYAAYLARGGASSTKQTAAEKAKELTDYYTPLIMQANPGMPIEQARVQAAQVAMRDPNARAQPDAAIGDMYRLNGKLYKPGKDGQLEEVFMPGDLKTVAGDVAKNLPPKAGTKNAPAGAAGAAPAPDGLKYTRSQVRGGWDYTPSGRSGAGKTKAEWAAEDAKLGLRQ